MLAFLYNIFSFLHSRDLPIYSVPIAYGFPINTIFARRNNNRLSIIKLFENAVYTVIRSLKIIFITTGAASDVRSSTHTIHYARTLHHTHIRHVNIICNNDNIIYLTIGSDVVTEYWQIITIILYRCGGQLLRYFRYSRSPNGRAFDVPCKTTTHARHTRRTNIDDYIIIFYSNN